jgi:hypothetical protein
MSRGRRYAGQHVRAALGQSPRNGVDIPFTDQFNGNFTLAGLFIDAAQHRRGIPVALSVPQFMGQHRQAHRAGL